MGTMDRLVVCPMDSWWRGLIEGLVVGPMEGLIEASHGRAGRGAPWRSWWKGPMEELVEGPHGGADGGAPWRGWWRGWWKSPMEGLVEGAHGGADGGAPWRGW